jgi:hypothetical protein
MHVSETYSTYQVTKIINDKEFLIMVGIDTSESMIGTVEVHYLWANILDK